MSWLLMPIAETGSVKARQLCTKHKGVLRTSDAIRLGVHARSFYNLRDCGEFKQVGRGIYRLTRSGHEPSTPITWQ